MARSDRVDRTLNKWAVRIIPIIITIAFIVGTYGAIGEICVKYLYRQKNKTAQVGVFIALYFILFLLTLAPYLRIFTTVIRDPGLVPLIHKKDAKSEQTEKNTTPDIEGQPWTPPDLNPDSPGLEAFYSKEVFVCEVDGRPKWCSNCRQWKPDRASHSSELGRCVRKMDHLCPWVGGMVAERSFNFFTQFTFYCMLYCTLTLAVAAYALQMQVKELEILDGWTIAVLVLTAFFLLFTSGMAMTSVRYCLINITNIDVLKRSQTYHLAVRIPLDTPPSSKYSTITYPLQPTSSSWTNGETREWQPENERDRLARRRFAIVQTKSRENPWDLGFAGNWKSVMGNNIFEWLFPLRHSPCCDHDSMVSDYPFGKVLDRLRERYELPPAHTNERIQRKRKQRRESRAEENMNGDIEMHGGVRGL